MSNDAFRLEIVHSKSNNPWFNLALEEFLFNNVKKDEVILYLWQNDNTIVIGKNQNPWKECRCKEFEVIGGRIARRLSGGGAVFHDMGNLNFTFIMHRDRFNIKRQLQVIIDAVKDFGIEAEFSGRNDITVQGKKFSGNAFYYDGEKAYHHGTLLVNSDINKMVKYLQVSKEKISSKGIDSVKSRVVNLNTLSNFISVDTLKKKLQASFLNIYDCSSVEEYIADERMIDIQQLYDKYSSWKWRYGETPEFDVSLENRFPFGNVDVNFSLHGGEITMVKIYSDALDYSFIDILSKQLTNTEFKKEAIQKSLREVRSKNSVIYEIANWLENCNDLI